MFLISFLSEKSLPSQVLGINIATVLLSPLFISERAVNSPQATLPLKLNSAFSFQHHMPGN